MKTVSREIQAETVPFSLWDLYKDETTFYNRWCLQWFEDFRQKEDIEIWDNDEWLQELYNGNKEHKKEFKQFVKGYYLDVDWKEVYKEFKEIWELKDRLNKSPEKEEGSFEVGKYYHYASFEVELYFKVESIKNPDEVWGYGWNVGVGWKESTYWCNKSDYKNAKEITRQQFLEKVKEYATNVLGFKGGATFQSEDLSTHTIAGGRGVYVRGDKLYVKNQELNSICIFSDGKFAEIVASEGAFNNTADKGSFWQPTMELRWIWNNTFGGETITKQVKVLQQKWINNSGDEEWRDIEEAKI